MKRELHLRFYSCYASSRQLLLKYSLLIRLLRNSSLCNYSCLHVLVCTYTPVGHSFYTEKVLQHETNFFLLFVCFLFCSSTGLFVFLYAMFYYFKRSNMSGMLQTIEFFGYTLLTCYVFFLMLGTVSFFASLKFVRYIYVNLKMD